MAKIDGGIGDIYVKKAGDTMTSTLTLEFNNPTLHFRAGEITNSTAFIRHDSSAGGDMIFSNNDDLFTPGFKFINLSGKFVQFEPGTFQSAGFVKNGATGVLTGGNSIDISDDTNLAVTAPIVLTGDTLSFDFTVANNFTATQTFSAATDSILVAQRIVHDGDADTFIEFTNDKISFQAGGDEFIVYIKQEISTYQMKMVGIEHLLFTEASINPAITTFNNTGVDIDFRIKGNSDSNLFFIDASRNNVGIGTNSVDVSAKLEINSTTGALLLPRMTTTQRDALTAVNGMLIYNSTNNVLEAYENGSWVNI